MATVEYDSPGCHDSQAACTGSSWAPLMRATFQTSHAVAHVAGSACPANGSLRCDDPVDLSGSSGLAAPAVESTSVLNDIQVQVRASGSAAWNTLRDYQLAYDQSGPSTITDPFSGVAQSTAGRLNLTRMTEIGADGSLALPSRSFSYTRQVQWYEDEFWGPAPATNCGPSWNVGTGQGCNLWSTTYEGNSYYLSTASNGIGLAQSFGWQLARDNSRGVPTGMDVLDPMVCNAAQSTAPCDRADAGAWSRVVLTQRSESVLRLSQNGQGGAQTSTPVTGTTTYSYRLAALDNYWGDWFDADVVDFYNGKWMGFKSATVTRPDGSREVHQYPGSLGFGVFDATDPMFASSCTSTNPCPTSPWWDPNNALHGRETEVDTYNTDGSLLEVVQTQYQSLCPPSGVTGDRSGRLVSELDFTNPVATCDIAPIQVDRFFVNGGSQSSAPHLTTRSTYDAYGRVTSTTETANDGAAGSPTTIVRKASYAWNDSVSATATSATGTYLVDLPALRDVEDSAGNRYRCVYTSYDGQPQTLGQTSAVKLGEATRSDTYTACGTSGNSFTPSGPISAASTYDVFGNVITTDDPDALAGSSAHVGCTAGTGTFSGCITYDGTFGVLPVASANALNQRSSVAYPAPAGATATGGFGLWPTSTTDANGMASSFTYDALGRKTGTALPGEGSGLTTEANAYTVWCSGTGAQSPCAEIDQTQRLDGSTTVTSRAFYDGLGHLVETRSPAPGGKDVVRYSFYDASERLAFQSVPYMVSAYTGAPGAAAYSIPDSTQPGTTHTYDGMGRATSSTDALSHRASTSYTMACGAAGTGDSACYLQTLNVDRDGHQGGTLVDALGRTDYEQRYTGSGTASYAVYATTRYTYDFAGNLVQILQPNGSTSTSIQYDMAGRKTGMTDPDRGTESYSYDANGNLVQSVDARGAAGTVFIGYDGLDRPLWHNTTNSPSGAYRTFSYDSTAGGNAGVGRLTGETFSGAPANTLSGGYGFVYDARGRQTGVTLTVGGTSYPMTATYNDAGDVLAAVYPDGETVTTAYTAQGWLSGVSTTQGTTTTTLLSGASYGGVGGAFGDVTGANLAGGAYQYSATYDLLGRAVDLTTKTSGGATLFEQARTFDPVGNIATVATTLPGGTDHQAFCYDEQNRLTWAGSAGTPPCTGSAIGAGTLTAAQYSQSFTYDTMGRLASGPPGSYTYGSGAHVHAATAAGASYTAGYDAAGDMTCRAPTGSTTCAGASPNGAQLGYDNEGQLVSWQSAPTSPATSDQFLYDGQGQRVAQVVTQGGATTTTVYVGGVEAVTTSGGATTTRTYYHAGGRLIAMALNGTFSYLASDNLGSANAVLSTGGTVTAAQLFTPFGVVRYSSGTMPTDYGFTGQRGDAASGLYYFGARYYDPVAGQFTSADTVLPGGGFNLMGLSRYAYTRNNPTSRTDPSGHDDFGGGDFGGGDFGGGDFSGGDFSGGDFSGGDFSGGDFSSGDTSSVDTSSVDTSSVDTTSVDTSSVDTGTGFDPAAPALDRSEDPIVSDSGNGSGFDPAAPPLDRSEDPIVSDSGNGNGFDPSAPPLDRSEDPINAGSPLADSVIAPLSPDLPLPSTDFVSLLASAVLGLAALAVGEAVLAVGRLLTAGEAAGGSMTGAELAAAGLSAENRVSQAIGVARNVGPGRVTIPGSGPGGFRVPDFNPAATIASRGTVVEVKDVASLSSSSQLSDMVAFARSQGVPLEIFTNAQLPNSGQLFNWIRSGQVIIRPLP
ncbi:MAG TPA: RHS repeat-associated core domain-containing protein [Candidatus Dormibacteraeota bacterium]